MISIKEIWKLQSESADQFVKVKLNDISGLNCYLGTILSTGNRVFILEIENEDILYFPEIGRFRGMSVQTLSYEKHKELTILLTDNELEEIFVSFIENIIQELAACATSAEALPQIAGVIFRWKKLFDRAGFAGLNKEQQKGLLGELCVIWELLKENKPAFSIIDAWTGPDFKDQDFDFNAIRLEIKLTTSNYPSAKITNERQLTTPSGVTLYLIIFVVEEMRKSGLTLTSVINEIEFLVRSDNQAKELFAIKLAASGYNADDRDFYLQEYLIRDQRIYVIDDNFPKITSNHITCGIYDVSYRIELSACEPFRIQNITSGQLIYGY